MTELVPKVEALGLEEVWGAELETRRVVWELASLVEGDEEAEGVVVVVVSVPPVTVPAHLAEHKLLIRRASPAIR